MEWPWVQAEKDVMVYSLFTPLVLHSTDAVVDTGPWTVVRLLMNSDPPTHVLHLFRGVGRRLLCLEFTWRFLITESLPIYIFSFYLWICVAPFVFLVIHVSALISSVTNVNQTSIVIAYCYSVTAVEWLCNVQANHFPFLVRYFQASSTV